MFHMVRADPDTVGLGRNIQHPAFASRSITGNFNGNRVAGAAVRHPAVIQKRSAKLVRVPDR